MAGRPCCQRGLIGRSEWARICRFWSALEVGVGLLTAARDSLPSPPNSATNSASGLYNLGSPIKGRSVPGAEVGGVFGWSRASRPVGRCADGSVQAQPPTSGPASQEPGSKAAGPAPEPASQSGAALFIRCILLGSLTAASLTWKHLLLELHHPEPGCPKR